MSFLYKFANILMVLMLVVSYTNVSSQTPMYYNYAINEHTNYFPFGVVGGERVQWLYPAGNFNQPSLAPCGTISKIYFFMGFFNGNATLTQLLIRLGQSDITTFSSGSFFSGQLDTVFYATSINLTSIAGQWMSITLDSTFYYDSSKSLIVDVSQCSASNGTIYVTQHSYPPYKRNYSFYSPCPSQYYGQDGYASNFGFDLALVGIKNEQNQFPKLFSLEQNYPNPFNPVTKIKFAIPQSNPPFTGHPLGQGGQGGLTTLKIYDILGHEIATLVNKILSPGTYVVEWNASDFPSGVYFYKLQTKDFVETKKLVLIK